MYFNVTNYWRLFKLFETYVDYFGFGVGVGICRTRTDFSVRSFGWVAGALASVVTFPRPGIDHYRFMRFPSHSAVAYHYGDHFSREACEQHDAPPSQAFYGQWVVLVLFRQQPLQINKLKATHYGGRRSVDVFSLPVRLLRIGR